MKIKAYVAPPEVHKAAFGLGLNRNGQCITDGAFGAVMRSLRSFGPTRNRLGKTDTIAPRRR
jgi:hypothetical protein